MKSPPSSPPSPPPSHSIELEHRLTGLEWESKNHGTRLSVLEKAILGLASFLYVVAQDRLPQIAATIRGILLP